MGGGHQGLAMAAHLSLSGEQVNLWNRTEEHISRIIETGKIFCQGAVEGQGEVYCASSKIEEVYEDVILVAVPASAHRDVARMLAPYVGNHTVIVLNPGRTFGAIDFRKCLREAGCRYEPKIAETQTILYTCRKTGPDECKIYALKRGVLFSALRPEDSDYVKSKLPDCMSRYFKKTENVFVTSLGNVGMILHCAPVLMNIGWIENQKVDFKYYYEGISPTVAGYIEKIDRERTELMRRLGIPEESTAEWMRRTYGIKGDSLYECIRNNTYYMEIDAPKTLKHRYLQEDIPCGLVPAESLGKLLKIPTSCMTLTIDLACAVMGTDYRKEGRIITKEDLDEVRGVF